MRKPASLARRCLAAPLPTFSHLRSLQWLETHRSIIHTIMKKVFKAIVHFIVLLFNSITYDRPECPLGITSCKDCKYRFRCYIHFNDE